MTIEPGSIAAILPAAGKSRRFGIQGKKIFARLGDRMVWEHAVERLRNRPEVGTILIAIDPDDETRWREDCAEALIRLAVRTVYGGAERAESVAVALRSVETETWIAVHDAARPLVRGDDLERLFAAADEHGAAILATPVRGTVKRQDVRDGTIATVDRRHLWEALTPQLFRADILRHAYERWNGYPATDDAQMVERSGHPVSLVEGSPTNIKITVADDLAVAAALLAAETA